MKAKAIIIVVAVGILGALGAANADKKPAATSSTTTSPTSTTTTASSNTQNSSQSSNTSYKDGNYTGSAVDMPYGTVQVEAVISAGKITDIKFLQMPFEEGHSRELTGLAEPQLKDMAISRQSAQIDFVSGATDTSMSFEQSLQAALDQAAAA